MKLFKKKKSLYDINGIRWVDDFHDGVAWFEIIRNGTHFYGVVNKRLEVIMEPIQGKLKSISEGLFPYYNGAAWGFIDKKCAVKIEPKYYDIGEGFTEGLAPVRQMKDGRYGYIGKNGLYKLPPIYQLAWNFKCGRAKVVIDGQFFFINKRGKVISKAIHTYYGL